jgi:hypothetical protein
MVIAACEAGPDAGITIWKLNHTESNSQPPVGHTSNVTSANPSWSRLITDASFRMSGCKITRPRLERIWSLATEGFSAEASTRITTERMAGELWSEVEGNTIEGVVEAVRRATLPGDPDDVDNLKLQISERDCVRVVSITIGGRALGPRVDVLVRGENPGWVRGRIGGLRDLFAETRTEWFIGRGHVRYLMALAGFILAFPISMSASSFPLFAHHLPARVILFGGGLTILTSLCYVFGSWIDRRSRTELRLPHEPAKRKIDVGVWALVVGIIGVITAIISTLSAHHVIPPPPANGSAPQGTRQGNRPADPPAYPGIGLSWAQAGVSWAQPTGSLVINTGQYPGLSASWAQTGVSWAQPAGDP